MFSTLHDFTLTRYRSEPAVATYRLILRTVAEHRISKDGPEGGAGCGARVSFEMRRLRCRSSGRGVVVIGGSLADDGVERHFIGEGGGEQSARVLILRGVEYGPRVAALDHLAAPHHDDLAR
jgi:hypothetical protein